MDAFYSKVPTEILKANLTNALACRGDGSNENHEAFIKVVREELQRRGVLEP